LLKGFAPADRVWELAKALRKSGLGRKLGFSIEGKILERGHGNRIVRAKIRNVAITNSPVNTDCTWDIVTKAFAPIEEIDKALHAGYANPAAAGMALVRESLEGGSSRPMNLSFADAVERLHRLRPHLSKAVCERIVRFAMKRS